MKNKDKNMKLRKLLLKIGISANNKSFFYILEGYDILNKRQIHFSMMNLYEMIARKFGENPNTVERLIRHRIEMSYKKSQILQNIYSKTPTNSKFLYDLVFNFDIFEEV